MVGLVTLIRIRAETDDGDSEIRMEWTTFSFVVWLCDEANERGEEDVIPVHTRDTSTPSKEDSGR